MAPHRSKLTAVEGPLRDAVFALAEAEWQVVGRDNTTTIHLDDPDIAGKHALFTFKNNQWHVQDLSTETGTRVNGLIISGNTALGEGDRVQIGETVFEISYPTADESRTVLDSIAPDHESDNDEQPAELWRNMMRTELNAVGIEAPIEETAAPDQMPEDVTEPIGNEVAIELEPEISPDSIEVTLPPEPAVDQSKPRAKAGADYNSFLSVATIVVLLFAVLYAVILTLNGQRILGPSEAHNPDNPRPAAAAPPVPVTPKPVNNPPQKLDALNATRSDVDKIARLIGNIDRGQGFATMIDQFDNSRTKADGLFNDNQLNDAGAAYATLIEQSKTITRLDQKRATVAEMRDRVRLAARRLPTEDTAIIAQLDLTRANRLDTAANQAFDSGDFVTSKQQWIEALDEFAKLKTHADTVTKSRDEAIIRRVAALAARSSAEKSNATIEAKTSWATASRSLADATVQFDQGSFDDAAKLWRRSESLFATAMAIAQSNRRLRTSESAFHSAAASSDLKQIRTHGGEQWTEIASALRTADDESAGFDARIDAYQLAAKLLPTAARSAKNNYIASLFAKAQVNDKPIYASVAIRYLDELLKLDPDHAAAKELRARVFAYRQIKIHTNTIGMRFVTIEPGQFDMGSPKTEADRNTDEARHRVTISKSFQMGVTEVTQAQWKTVMGKNNPSRFKSDDLPVEGVTFEDAVRFCEKLGKREGVTYRLPTESEWEYACRANNTSSFAVHDDQPLSDVAWFNHDGLKIKSTHPVGKLKPNAWGLHDMHGNVWEWCSDFSGHYPTDPVTDPTGPTNGKYHVIRGGSWFNPARYARSAHRGQGVDGALFGMTGFRVVLQNAK